MDGEIKRQTSSSHGKKRGGGHEEVARVSPWIDQKKIGLQDSDEVGLLQVNFLYHGTSENLTWNILKFVLSLKFLIFYVFYKTF